MLGPVFLRPVAADNTRLSGQQSEPHHRACPITTGAVNCHLPDPSFHVPGADNGRFGIGHFPAACLLFVFFHGFSPLRQYMPDSSCHTSSTEIMTMLCRKCKLFPAALHIRQDRDKLLRSVLRFISGGDFSGTSLRTYAAAAALVY